MRFTLLSYLIPFVAFTAAAPYIIPPEHFKRTDEPIATDSPKLKPINAHLYDSAVSGNALRKRDVDDLKNIEPQDSAKLVYGAVNADGNILLANMTLYAPDGKPIVSMETFEGYTKAVDCNGKDGQLSITFSDKAAFEYAIKTWSYINEDIDTQFILITNHDGCGPDDERQPYMVNEVDNDEEKFITYLKVTEAKWEDIAGSFDLDFGKAALSSEGMDALGVAAADDNPKKFVRRGFLDDINPVNWGKKAVEAGKDLVEAGKDFVEDTVDAIKGGAKKVGKTVGDVISNVGKGIGGFFGKLDYTIDDAIKEIEDAAKKAGKAVDKTVDDFVDGIEDVIDAITDIRESESVMFPMYIGKPNSPINLYKNDIVKVDCSNCFVGGSFKLTGTVRIKYFIVKELSVELRPHDFKAALEVTTGLNVKFDKSGSYSSSKDVPLFEIPIPNAGIVVPGIISIGAVTGMDAGYAISASADVSFTVGLNAQVPNAAYVRVDLANLGNSGAGGWGGVSVTPVVKFDVTTANVKGAVYLRPKIAVKIELLKLGKAEVAVKLDLPKVSAEASVKQDKTKQVGVCPNSKKEFGLSVDMGASFGLVVVAEASIIGLFDEKWEKSLFSVDIYKKNICLPFDNPFDKNGNKIAAPPLSLAPPTPIQSLLPIHNIKPGFLATKLQPKLINPTKIANIVQKPKFGDIGGFPGQLIPRDDVPTVSATQSPSSAPSTAPSSTPADSEPKKPVSSQASPKSPNGTNQTAGVGSTVGAKWVPIKIKADPAAAIVKAKEGFKRINHGGDGSKRLPGKVTVEEKKVEYMDAAPVAELPKNLNLKGPWKDKLMKKPQIKGVSSGATRLLVKEAGFNGTVAEPEVKTNGTGVESGTSANGTVAEPEATMAPAP